MESPTESQLSYRGELQRKALHLSALVAPAAMYFLGREGTLLIIAPLAILAVAADVLRTRSAGFARFIDTTFGGMMRPSERPPVGGPVVLNGATWVLVTASLLALFFPIAYAVPAFVAFMVADAAAALIGRRWGRHPWGQSARTVEGSLAFFVVCLATLAFFPGFPGWALVVAAAVGAAAEAIPRPLNDNVRVPLVIALVLFLIARYVLETPVSLFSG